MFRTTVTGMTIAALVSGVCWAGPFEARMLNKRADGERMVFEPAFVKAAPRDTIRFIPTTRSIRGLVLCGVNGPYHADVTQRLPQSGLRNKVI